MKPSLPPEPASGTATVSIPSHQFNRIRLALLRQDGQLRTVLGARNLEFHLSCDAWVCFDRRLGAQPALAWTDFAVSRDTLAAPVPARVLYYNAYAKAFTHLVLPELAERLDSRASKPATVSRRIVAFRR